MKQNTMSLIYKIYNYKIFIVVCLLIFHVQANITWAALPFGIASPTPLRITKKAEDFIKQNGSISNFKVTNHTDKVAYVKIILFAGRNYSLSMITSYDKKPDVIISPKKLVVPPNQSRIINIINAFDKEKLLSLKQDLIYSIVVHSVQSFDDKKNINQKHIIQSSLSMIPIYIVQYIIRPQHNKLIGNFNTLSFKQNANDTLIIQNNGISYKYVERLLNCNASANVEQIIETFQKNTLNNSTLAKNKCKSLGGKTLFANDSMKIKAAKNNKEFILAISEFGEDITICKYHHACCSLYKDSVKQKECSTSPTISSSSAKSSNEQSKPKSAKKLQTQSLSEYTVQSFAELISQSTPQSLLPLSQIILESKLASIPKFIPQSTTEQELKSIF